MHIGVCAAGGREDFDLQLQEAKVDYCYLIDLYLVFMQDLPRAKVQLSLTDSFQQTEHAAVRGDKLSDHNYYQLY